MVDISDIKEHMDVISSDRKTVGNGRSSRRGRQDQANKAELT
jgi:hypothetical protein